MKNDELLFKLVHNKKILFILPNFIYLINILNSYNTNSNVQNILEVSGKVCLEVFGCFFVITLFLYPFLKKALKNRQKTFLVLSFACCFYFYKFSLIQFLILIVVILSLTLLLLKIRSFNFDYIVGILIFIISFIFIMIGGKSVYNFVVNSYSLKVYKTNNKIAVDNSKKSPNIYYIHCDGMLGISAMLKYFQYDDTYFIDYLDNNNFYLNKDASFINGHKTQRSLVALFNPHYYDKVFRKYLDDIEGYYYGKKINLKYNVDYKEINENRFDSELFRAFEKKGYTTIGIGEFNQYTSLDTDYYYDYYVPTSESIHLVDGKEGLRLIKKSDNKKLMSYYVEYQRFRTLTSYSMLYDITNNINFLKYKNIDYKSFDSSKYSYIDNSQYWPAKAILKGLDESINSFDGNKLIFVDYNLNHLGLTFDKYGNRLNENDSGNLNYYEGNYVYSTYLLVDMLRFIKDNDKDAIIIIQGDHGIHMLENEYLEKRFSIGASGVKDIRNSVISAMYIPDKYRNGDEKYLSNPLNISRYLVNSYVYKDYDYIK